MPKKIFIVSILLLFMAILSLPFLNKDLGQLKAKQLSPRERTGEEITYEVKLGNMSLGEAKFRYSGKVNLEGKTLNLMVLETKVFNFSDTENIYTDLKDFLPVRIERDITSFLKKERIIEDYDQKNYLVTITKINSRKPKKSIIRSKGVIHNAILFPYAVRDLSDLKVGQIFAVNLPSRNLQVKLVSIENLKLAKGTFEAFHFESTPKQIAVWISTDERRIPLKIEGAGIFSYSLVLKDYHP